MNFLLIRFYSLLYFLYRISKPFIRFFLGTHEIERTLGNMNNYISSVINSNVYKDTYEKNISIKRSFLLLRILLMSIESKFSNMKKINNEYISIIDCRVVNKKNLSLVQDEIDLIENDIDDTKEKYFDLKSTINFLIKSKNLSYSSNVKIHDFTDKIFISQIYSRKVINCLCKIKFDPKTKWHLDLLNNLWKNTFVKCVKENIINPKYYYENLFYKENNSKLKETEINMDISEKDLEFEITNDKWMWIGFQSKHPETDFRSTGIFGLMQLTKFSTSSNFEEVFKIGTVKWFFFAAAGINLTAKIFTVLLSSNLNEDLLNTLEYSLNDRDYKFYFNNDYESDIFQILESYNFAFNIEKLHIKDSFVIDKKALNNFVYNVMNVLNLIYSEIFLTFALEWKQKTNVSFMNFNTEFESFIEKELMNICIASFSKFFKRNEKNEFY